MRRPTPPRTSQVLSAQEVAPCAPTQIAELHVQSKQRAAYSDDEAARESLARRRCKQVSGRGAVSFSSVRLHSFSLDTRVLCYSRAKCITHASNGEPRCALLLEVGLVFIRGHQVILLEAERPQHCAAQERLEETRQMIALQTECPQRRAAPERLEASG